MKWLQLGILAIIASALLWGGSRVRALPGRVFSGHRPAQLDEGRQAFESKNYAVAVALLTEAIDRSSATYARESALLLAEVRLAQRKKRAALDLLRQYAPGVDADSFVSAHPPQPIRNTIVRAMYCDVGDELADTADASWCERYLQYYRDHPHGRRGSALRAASGGQLDSATIAQLREDDSWWRSYCIHRYGRPGEFGPYQEECRDRGLARSRGRSDTTESLFTSVPHQP